MINRYCEMQFQMALTRANHWNALISSGAYRLSKTQRGCGKNPDGTIAFRDMTDDEKLESAIATANAHMRFAQECLEAFGNSVKDDE